MEKQDVLSLLHQTDTYDFESVIADLWERQGWDTHVTQGSNDMGIDVIAERSTPFSQKIVIQAKRYGPGATVGGPDIQQYASLRQQVDKVDAVVIVTTSQFSAPAQKIADKLNVKLVNGEQLYEIFEFHDAFDILHQYLDIPRTETSKNSDERPEKPANRIELSGDVPIGKHSKVESRLRKKIDPITGEKKIEVLGYEVEILSVTPRARATTPRSVTKETSFYWS